MKRLALSLLFATTAAHAAITGTVFDEGGKPVAGATVHAYAAEDSRAWRARVMRGAELPAIATAQSGESGVFRIDAKTPLAVLVIDATGKVPLSLEAADGDDLEAIVLRAGPVPKLHLLAGGKPIAPPSPGAGGTVRTSVNGIATPTGWTMDGRPPGKTVVKSMPVTVIGGQTVTVNVD